MRISINKNQNDKASFETIKGFNKKAFVKLLDSKDKFNSKQQGRHFRLPETKEESSWQWVVKPISYDNQAECQSIGAVGLNKVTTLNIDEISTKITEVATDSLLNNQTNQIEVTFNNQRLAGVSCVVSLVGKNVSCKVRTQSAIRRGELARLRRSVVNKLNDVGLALDEYEVSQ
jgi:hypothetical protein